MKRVVDVRLNNNSQLAGFSKKDDLAYFLQEIGGIEYFHLPNLPRRRTSSTLTRSKRAIGVFTKRSFWI